MKVGGRKASEIRTKNKYFVLRHDLKQEPKTIAKTGQAVFERQGGKNREHVVKCGRFYLFKFSKYRTCLFGFLSNVIYHIFLGLSRFLCLVVDFLQES